MARLGTNTSDVTFKLISVRKNDLSKDSTPWVNCSFGSLKKYESRAKVFSSIQYFAFKDASRSPVWTTIEAWVTTFFVPLWIVRTFLLPKENGHREQMVERKCWQGELMDGKTIMSYDQLWISVLLSLPKRKQIHKMNSLNSKSISDCIFYITPSVWA